MQKVSLVILTALTGLLFLSSCGYNPKEGGNKVPALPFVGTVECLYSGCHDSQAYSAGVFPGFNPVASWSVGVHSNTNNSPVASSGTAAGCASCHNPVGQDDTDSAYLFSTTSVLGTTVRPIGGCESCHGSGAEHYAYWDTTSHPVYAGSHRVPLPSTVWGPAFEDALGLSSCGPCHAPDQHAGGSSNNDILANQYAEWYGQDGPGTFFDDGHSDTIASETSQGMMTSDLRGTPCAACHTTEGFVRFYAWADTAWASSPTEVGRIVSDTETLAMPQVSCVSCHPSHEPGMTVRPMLLSGGAPGDSDTQRNVALCGTCHNVRGLDASAGAGVTGTAEIPRHPQQEVFEGVNSPLEAFTFPGFTYSNSSHAGTGNIPSGCVGCHYATVTDVRLDDFPQKATTGHDFRPRLEGCMNTSVDPSFNGCHAVSDFSGFSYADTTIGSFDFSSLVYSGTTYATLFSDNDYDMDGSVEGFQVEVQGMLDDLQSRLKANGGVFDSAQGLFDLPAMTSVSDTVKGAAYNYDYVVGDRSLGLHNPLYVVNILAASLSVLP